jgi:hypothetical protein
MWMIRIVLFFFFYHRRTKACVGYWAHRRLFFISLPEEERMYSSVDTIWVLFASALVFFMQAGFAMVETV